MLRAVVLALPAAILLPVVAEPAAASAQTAPSFVNAKKEGDRAKTVEWNAAAQAGLVHITGNTQQTVVSGGVTASRKQGYNKLALQAAVQYARTSLLQAVDTDGDAMADAIERDRQTTAQAWEIKARYDRFLTEHNSVYISALASGDEPAGKSFVSGAQIGYSRQMYKDSTHEVVGEAGYDFGYEDLSVGDAVSIHSGRLFTGYTGKITATTSLAASIEVLMNINSIEIGARDAGPFEDTRALTKLELTTQLFGDLSFNFGVTAKYDAFPALLEVGGVAYRAEKLDTTTKASLIYNFLR